VSTNMPVMPRQQMRLATRFGNWLLGTNAALVFGFIYLPVIILIIFSFNNTRSVALFTGFSTEWYVRLANNEELLDAARNSLLVGLITTIVATIIGIVALLVAATGLFHELKGALNTVWGVRPKPGTGIRSLIRDRLLSFGVLLVVAFMLLVTLASAGVTMAGQRRELVAEQV